MQGWSQQHPEGLISNKMKTKPIVNVKEKKENTRCKYSINIYHMVGKTYPMPFNMFSFSVEMTKYD